jgi:catechol 2,3-dioxygenase-like lactoylglutathione lyase family enzyme
MIAAVHTVLYAHDAEAARAFFRDVLGMSSVDAGDGWLIFALPSAELACHPGAGRIAGRDEGRSELFLMCTDVAATRAELEAAGVEFVVVSGDMIEGTITATLLERANPGAIEARKQDAGRLFNVAEFAAEVASAAVDPIPADHTRYVGDTSGFVREA